MDESIPQTPDPASDTTQQPPERSEPSERAPSEALCKAIFQARYEYDTRVKYGDDPADTEYIIKGTQRQLSNAGYAKPDPERILRSLAYVDGIISQRKRDGHLKEFVKTVGPRYAECALDNFKADHPLQQKTITALRAYASHMSDHVANGSGLIFFGPSGTGKDHLLVAMGREAIAADIGVLWENGRDLFGNFRKAIGNDEDEDDLLRPLFNAGVLAISDPLPPSGALTAYQQDILYRIVDARYRAKKPIWVTLNVSSGREAGERLGEPIADRLRDGAVALSCNWPSHRKPME